MHLIWLIELLRKLYSTDVEGVPCDWIVSYLTNRTQFTVIDNIKPQSNAVDQGVL